MAAATSSEVEYERSVCQRYSKRICAYGLRHLRDVTAAEDLAQEVLLSVLQALRCGNVRDNQHLDRYVFGTCRNAALAMQRGRARQRRIADATAGVLPLSYEAPWLLPDKARLESCLERLEARARAVIIATFVDERDAEDIGRSMGLSAANVRVIRHRALAALQRCLDMTGRA